MLKDKIFHLDIRPELSYFVPVCTNERALPTETVVATKWFLSHQDMYENFGSVCEKCLNHPEVILTILKNKEF